MIDTAATYIHALFDRGERTPDKLWMQEVDGEQATFAQSCELTCRWANALGELSVGSGDMVATLIENCLDSQHVWLGAALLRAVEVPLSPLLRGDSLVHALNDSRCGCRRRNCASVPERTNGTVWRLASTSGNCRSSEKEQRQNEGCNTGQSQRALSGTELYWPGREPCRLGGDPVGDLRPLANQPAGVPGIDHFFQLELRQRPEGPRALSMRAISSSRSACGSSASASWRL